MQINRQTYEEYFLLYADGELNDTEKLEVEDFVDQNPDLGGELEVIMQTVMIPDESIVFANKEILLKEEGNRKVIAMRWMRFAAAAAVLVGLMAAGWIFLGDDARKVPPVAVVQPEKVPVVQKSQDSITPPADNKEVPVVAKSFPKKVSTSKLAIEKNGFPAPRVELQKEEPIPNNDEPFENNTPDAAPVSNDVAFIESAAAPIDIQVEPREMAQEDLLPVTNNVHYTQALEEDREKGDQIYFANTQLSKKTKLRGVLRKASRYLERVTTIQ